MYACIEKIHNCDFMTVDMSSITLLRLDTTIS